MSEVMIFHNRMQPEEGIPAGYAALAEAFGRERPPLPSERGTLYPDLYMCAVTVVHIEGAAVLLVHVQVHGAGPVGPIATDQPDTWLDGERINR